MREKKSENEKGKSHQFFWQKFAGVYRQTFTVLKENPTIAIPFFLIACFDFLALALLFYAPSEPVSLVVAPIIRTFWGEQFLHYPENFVLLPKLLNHAHFIILSLFGISVTGIAIKKIEARAEGEQLSIVSAAGPVFKKYFSLLTAWLAFYGIFMFSLKHILRLLPSNVGAQLAAGFCVGLAIQTLFAFLFPALLISGRGFFKDLREGILTAVRNFGLTSSLIALPMALLVTLSFFKALAPLMVRFNPEMVLWVLAAGIIISMIVDLLVTASTTLLYLQVREDKS